ncbi:MAG: hypothetical protein RIR70_1883 [Pseudomonadota bacterium]|jgi:hypothetical protein
MPRKPRNVRSRTPENARLEIAHAAARLIAEDGITDYGMAKRKAAYQLGLPEHYGLPNNDEVGEALRTYQALYQDEDQPAQLHELRSLALEALRYLAPFSPYLIGAVLDGTAGQHSEIEIEAFAESAKEVELFLLNRNIDFQHARTPRGPGEAPEAVFEIDWQDAPLRLTVWHTLAERNRAKNRNGKPTPRAREAALAALLSQDSE